MAKIKKAAAAAEGNQSTVQNRDEREREAWVAKAAYYLAEKRGFMPGTEVTNWLDAERCYLDQVRPN